MGSFTITRLANQRSLVRGEDKTGAIGETVVSHAQWDELNVRSKFDEASAEFDRAVQEFFAPLTEAAEKAAATVAEQKDELSFVVLGDEVEHVQGEAAQVVELSKDSQILRAIETDQTDRLIWVGGDLEITEFVPAPDQSGSVDV
jgi:uncharacterized protein YgbK (DUF1537 family)